MRAKEENVNLEKLEDASFEFEKGAFDFEDIKCSTCKKNMRKTELEIRIDDVIYVKIMGFVCPKCNKQYLSLEQSKKLDKALVLSRMNKDGFTLTRKLSFDGSNYVFRVPKEFTDNIDVKREVKISPIGNKGFCVHVV